MAQQTIGLGATANDGTGDPARTAFGKVNSNFVEVYAGVPRVLNAQTGTAYTLALVDGGALVTLSNASPVTLTIPANGTVAFPVGTQVDLAQVGAGQVTVAAAGGVTLQSAGSQVKLTGQYSAGTLVKLATNTWLLAGDLSS